MIIKILNITPKVGAVAWDELVELIDKDEDILGGNINVSETCCLDDAYTVLIYLLANKFAEDVLDLCDRFKSQHGQKFCFGLHYERGRIENGFQLIIDFDNVKLDYQRYLTKYFEWDSIKYEPALNFDNFRGTIFD